MVKYPNLKLCDCNWFLSAIILNWLLSSVYGLSWHDGRFTVWCQQSSGHSWSCVMSFSSSIFLISFPKQSFTSFPALAFFFSLSLFVSVFTLSQFFLYVSHWVCLSSCPHTDEYWYPELVVDVFVGHSTTLRGKVDWIGKGIKYLPIILYKCLVKNDAPKVWQMQMSWKLMHFCVICCSEAFTA